MARTLIPLTPQPANNGGLTVAGGVAIDPVNGMYVESDGTTNIVQLLVVNTVAAAQTVTVKASAAMPPGQRKDIGDLAINVAASATVLAGPFESARFVQQSQGISGNADGGPGGRLWINFPAGMTGTVYAFQFPRNATA